MTTEGFRNGEPVLRPPRTAGVGLLGRFYLTRFTLEVTILLQRNFACEFVKVI